MTTGIWGIGLRNLIVFICLTAIISTNAYGQKKIYKDEAVKLNDKAMLLTSSPELSKQILDSALILLNNAIRIDPTYYIAYVNKAAILLEMREREKALATVTKLLTIKPNLIEAMSLQGVILHCLGRNREAQAKFDDLLSVIEKKIKAYPDSVNLRLTYAIQLIISGRQEAGITEYRKQLADHPNNPDVVNMREIIEGFDREQYLKDICK